MNSVASRSCGGTGGAGGAVKELIAPGEL